MQGDPVPRAELHQRICAALNARKLNNLQLYSRDHMWTVVKEQQMLMLSLNGLFKNIWMLCTKRIVFATNAYARR